MRATMPKDEKAARALIVQTRPAFQRDDVVIVEEPGIRPWEGSVKAVKPSLVSGWWIDVRDDDGIERTVHASRLRRREET